MHLIKFIIPSFAIFLLINFGVDLQAQNQILEDWKTNTNKSLIDLDELEAGGPPKDGIPSIDDPQFVSPEAAQSWISGKEPVISFTYRGETRAYPLQILIWHEIVNDRIDDEPVLVTFCPLCYSAIVFERTVDEDVLDFGVSGFLRHSDLVMFDRETETLWQQFTGRAIVGDYVGTTLKQIPSQIISFNQFRENNPEGKVLSRNTGYQRNYGSNPYTGYDDINNTPLFGDTEGDDRLPPMEKVVGVKIGEETKTYPYSITKEKRVINDRIGETPVAVFHLEGARSAMDASEISDSREDGSTGVFERRLKGELLTFEIRSDKIYDKETGSRWNITGKSVEGPMKNEQLPRVTAGDYFAFAWLTFWPDTEIYPGNDE